MEAGATSTGRMEERARLGMWVFVVSLIALFGAGIALFVLARTGGGGHLVRDVERGARIALPVWMWGSTLLVFCSSVALHQGLSWGRMGLPAQARRAVRGAAGAGWGFLILQVPALLVLVDRYRAVSGIRPVVVFLVVTLSGLHLLHAAGGAIALARLASRGPTPAPGGAWSLMAIYWHFLAGLWLVLFLTFALVR
jgi:heme/copper-type cytochrome/quinol oxidase subunit 3